jgi:hypothetical protein
MKLFESILPQSGTTALYSDFGRAEDPSISMIISLKLMPRASKTSRNRSKLAES